MLAAAAVALALCMTACSGTSAKADPSASPSAAPTSTPEPAVEKVKVATVSEIDGPLNIRSDASTDSEILGTANSGDRFEVLTENYTGLWHEISYNGGKAYVYAEFVTVTEMDKTALNTGSASDPQASADPAQAAATPDPNAPITVNGSGRENVSTSSSEGVTAESIRDTEDPERR
ncbi:MAG: SH3 domain-containing protein [Hominenteromicrobium sp.]